jgi:hypothetical protein
MGVDKVDRVVLAGAFGAHISPKHAMVLGMIPDVPLDKVFSAGNAAGTGARIALCNVAARAAIEATVRQIHKVETAIEPRFRSISSTPTRFPTRPTPSPNWPRSSPCRTSASTPAGSPRPGHGPARRLCARGSAMPNSGRTPCGAAQHHAHLAAPRAAAVAGVHGGMT